MKICSFLPSATEILFALGVGEQVAGVTFECDYPAAAANKAVVVHSAMQSGLLAREIDDAVRQTARDGGSLYFVDWPLLEQLAPELIVAQDLCRVCAISTPALARDLGQLAAPPRVLSLSPHSLAEVLENIEAVGEAVGHIDAAAALTASLRGRIKRVEKRVHERVCECVEECVGARAKERQAARSGVGAGYRPRVLCLEWLDPLYQGGHWIPEMVALTGGEAVLATSGEKSVRIDWEQVAAADPEIIVLMPCGFNLDETLQQFRAMPLPPCWAHIAAVRRGEIYAVAGGAYFSRPGPRLVDGLEILEAILRGDGFDSLPPHSIARMTDVGRS